MEKWMHSNNETKAAEAGELQRFNTEVSKYIFSFALPRSAESLRIPKMFLNTLQLFQRRPDLVSTGKYTITSDADPKVVVLLFARVIGDKAGLVTLENAGQLRALCDGLGFSGFNDEFRAV